MNPRFHSLSVKEIRKETDQAVSILFDVPTELADSYQFLPGQHLSLEALIDNEKVRRSYSICTTQFENELRVAVKKMPFGKFSTYANDVLQVNDTLQVMIPAGEFTTEIKEDTTKNFIFFAAGSGITPIMSLVKTILHTAPNSNVTLIYGNRGFEHIIFRDEFERLKDQFMTRFSLLHVFSEEKIGNQIQDGLLDKEMIQRLYDLKIKDEGVDDVFVCGPHPCIIAVRDVFLEAGIDKHHIHFELFTSPDDDKKENATPTNTKVRSNVKVILDDEEMSLNLNSDGDSVLDAAINAGMDAPYSCKGGVCSTCRAKVLKGEVKMDKNYALEDEEVEAGYILTCQAHPISKELIVSYDE